MRVAGVTAATEEPPGGEIIRDEAGQPTGIFVETAAALVSSAYAVSRESMTTEERDEESMRALLLAQEEAPSYEVLFMDNASVDGTVEYLESLPIEHKRIINVPKGEKKSLGTLGTDFVLEGKIPVTAKVTGGSGEVAGDVKVQVCTKNACDRPRTHGFRVPTT